MTEFRPTELKRLEQYKDRWSSYGANTGILEISEKPNVSDLKQIDIFQDYDDAFLEKLSADISVAIWKKDSVLFEEGSYIDVAFYLLHGEVEVFLRQLQKQSRQLPLFEAHRTKMFDLPAKEQQKPDGPPPLPPTEKQFKTQLKSSERPITFLSVMDFNLPAGGGLLLQAGDFFGEIGALSGWPQSVTARAASDVQVVQIRVPALRLMRRKSNKLKSRIDEIYRKRFLPAQLKASPLFYKCDEPFLEGLSRKVQLISCEPDEVIVREGEPVDAFYLVRSGFVKLSQKWGEGQIAATYLSKGMTLGETELLIENIDGWTSTASSVKYSELIKISKEDFAKILKEFPGIEKQLWESSIARIRESGFSKKNLNHAEFIQTALEDGLVQGNSILVIDLNQCTRCDDCVRGCSANHGGLPRFIREGSRYENLLITRACYHCRDPLCLVGCPTGAIHRTGVGHVVAIDEKICIGCQSCANSCPFDAITMHKTNQTWPMDMVPEGLRGKDRLLATKCDLCYTSTTGPNCVRSCPNGCAYRVGTLEEFQAILLKTR
jgi:CRP-like cAMP-binding protein/Fe-S-cluster-containing dehydrogenase component